MPCSMMAAACLLLMLLCQPLLQIHHLIYAFPALIYMIGELPKTNRMVVGTLLVAIALMLNSRGWNAFEKLTDHWIAAFLTAPQAWGVLLLLVIMIEMVKREPNAVN